MSSICRCRCFFFFSSRRRHTRLQGDWSSDVCSSDLLGCRAQNVQGLQQVLHVVRHARPGFVNGLHVGLLLELLLARSEEHTSELQSPCNLVCRLLLEKKTKTRLYAFRDHHEPSYCVN